MAGDDTHELNAGWVVATRSEHGLVVRRRPFTNGARSLWLLYAVTVVAGVVGGGFAPFFFVAAAILAAVLGLISLMVSGAERAVAPWVRSIRRTLEVLPAAEGGAGYRSAADGSRARVVVDGRELGQIHDVRVHRRRAERGDGVAYALYAVGPEDVVTVTITADADAARDLRQMLRDALGLERAGGLPTEESHSTGLGCWSFLLAFPYLGLVLWIAIASFQRAASSAGAPRFAVLAGAGLALLLLELVFSQLLAWTGRGSARAWAEETFGSRSHE